MPDRIKNRGKKVVEKVLLLAHAAIAELTNLRTTTDPIPLTFILQAKKAREYYLTVGIVKKCIVFWRALILGESIGLITDNEANREKLLGLANRIRLDKSTRNQFTAGYVRGEFLAKKVLDEDGRLERIRSINPCSVVCTYDKGELISIQQTYDENGKTLGTPIDLLKKGDTETAKLYYHYRHESEDWSLNGSSMILPAFELIEILLAYLKAEKSIAKRWSSLLRLVQIGGKIGEKIFEPGPGDITKYKNILDELDPDSALVVPSYVDAKTVGSEGVALDTVPRIKLLMDSISIAMLFVPFLVTGTGTPTGGARVLYKGIKSQIREQINEVQYYLNWVFDADTLAAEGIDSDTKITYQFSALDIDVEQWEREFLLKCLDDGIIDRKTLQLLLGYDPAVIDANLEKQPITISTNWSAQDVIGLIATGVLTADEVKQMLGMQGKAATPPQQAAASVREIYRKVKDEMAKKPINHPKKTKK